MLARGLGAGMWLLDLLLRRFVKGGRLIVFDWRGRQYLYQGRDGPAVVVRLHDRATARALVINPSLALGEAYMNGSLTVEQGTLYDLIDLAALNYRLARYEPWLRWRDLIAQPFRWLMQWNDLRRARRNVAHHYDLTGELYSLFLDSDRQYSCAYYTHPDDSLEDAQHQKKRHIAAKLLLRPGQKVLDIGSGWGGLGLFLAREAGAKLVGATLSREQCLVSNRRAREAGLDDRVEFVLRDYRTLDGAFDRIVSVGMFEHVGISYYPTFFAKLGSLLVEDGVALVHTIGRCDGPAVTDPFIRKYIFRGGYIPALSEILPAIERAGLVVTDIELLRLHYADTLRDWRRRFHGNRERVKALFDERFCRMWEYYLAASEVAFRRLDMVVFQIQLAHRQDAVPITRDYIGDHERAIADPASAAA